MIHTVQDLTEIEDKVLELKEHIESITLVMVKAIEGKERASIPQDLLDDIERLRTCISSCLSAILFVYSLTYRNLSAIKRDLDEIAAQSKLLIVLFKNANKAKVDRCMELLKNSFVHWDVRCYLSIVLLSVSSS